MPASLPDLRLKVHVEFLDDVEAAVRRVVREELALVARELAIRTNATAAQPPRGYDD